MQLAEVGREIKNFRGIFSIDQLPETPWVNECGIINLQKYSDGPGTHWTCYEKKGNEARYFDAFGQVYPPTEVATYLKGTNLTFNTLKHQSYEESRCGQMCLLFLMGQLENVDHRLT